VRLVQLLAICTIASGACGTTVRGGENIEIKQAWSRATPNGSPVAAGYLTIENQGSSPDRLLEVNSASARKVELHTTVVENGVASMRPVNGGLLIPANGSVTLQPGGNHLMFIGLSAPLAEGTRVPVELYFEKAGKIAANLDVAAIGSLTPPTAALSTPSTANEAVRNSENDFFTHLCGDRLMVNVTVSPARPGDFEIFVELEDTQERPLAAKAVSITLTDENHESLPVTANAERVSDEKWRVKMSASKRGNWLLSLNVDTSQTGQVEIAAPIVID
jgi:copper(I)-binding protein